MDDYITVEEAAGILRVVPRQVNRYGNGPNARLRTRKAGRRVLYHRGDVETLADDLGVANKPISTRLPMSELVPQGKVLEEWRAREREHQDQVDQLNERLHAAAHRIGELEGQLQLRTKEITELKQQPWWKRLFGR